MLKSQGIILPLFLASLPLTLVACGPDFNDEDPTLPPGDNPGISLREATDITCADGIDNDGDALVDCASPSCLHTPSVTVCGGGSSSESDDEACVDGIDNDGDGAIDCKDDDCLWNGEVAVCDRDKDGYLPYNGDCFDHPTLELSRVVSPGNPELCGDGEDGDCDGIVDEAEGCTELDLGLLVIEEIYDGDTIRVEGLGSVRFKGIDTPENSSSQVECFGPEAEARTVGLLRGGVVRVVLDPVDYQVDFRDFYGRVLAHLYTEDGTYVNGVLAEEGFACVYETFACFNKPILLSLQEEAIEGNEGLWESCGELVCF